MYRIVRYLTLLSIVLCINSYNLYAGDTTNLQAAYLLEESSGTRFDETANNNDLTDNNTVAQATGANCKFSNCADFERANNEWLSITDASQTGLDLTGDFSLGAWVRLENFASDEHFIIEKFILATGYILQIIGSQVAACTTDADNAIGSTTISEGTFFHIACTYTATSLQIYVNGTSETTTVTSDDPTNNAEEFLVGANTNTGANNWDGIMDDVFVFSRQISGAEITDIKDNGLSAFISPARNRVIVIANVIHVPHVFNIIKYYGLVNDHRTKYGIERPWWMYLYDWRELFTIPEAYAAPTQADTDTVNSNFDDRDAYQTSYHSIHSKYQQQVPVTLAGITYRTHVYDGPLGVGCLHTAQKVEGTDTYQMERHTGPETTRNFRTAWTILVEE